MAQSEAQPGALPLEGEDLSTEHWEDARHWLSVYADLLAFKRGLLDRIKRDLTRLPPEAQVAAAADLGIIESQMDGYLVRLDLWYQRVWDLHGLWIDPDSHVIRHQGQEASLTNREYQLLNFLVQHPHRYFTPAQILSSAWADPSLFPEEVRNYVQRLRRLLRRLDIPAEVVNRPGRGYSLVFREA
jgi:DNA-binding response OmpR family regulator